MGVIVHNRPSERLRRVHAVWRMRLRYWWMDTEGGQQTRLALCVAALLVSVAHFAMLAVQASMPPQGEPARAPYWWVVQLIIAIVSAIISYALRPKPQGVSPQEQDAPTVEDGQSTLEVHGDCWIDDEFILAQRVVGKDPIKTGGKK